VKEKTNEAANYTKGKVNEAAKYTSEKVNNIQAEIEA
jgi:cell fate (sporulation/competence/biofilm development) regulator YmcA (YheA/YmcA/DUF963 family)